jgi:hypothetical protein
MIDHDIWSSIHLDAAPDWGAARAKAGRVRDAPAKSEPYAWPSAKSSPD